MDRKGTKFWSVLRGATMGFCFLFGNPSFTFGLPSKTVASRVMESATTSSTEPTCDESRCISRGLSDLYDGSFTCYGGDENGSYPRMCADGYIPVVLEVESMVETVHGDVRYFTCCPPGFENNSEPTTRRNAIRRCSDPYTGDLPALCEEQEQKNRSYARPMKTARTLEGLGAQFITETNSILCCDSPTVAAEETTFLDDVECVPYRNDFFYSPAKVLQNRTGIVGENPIVCDISEGPFRFPRAVGENRSIVDVASTGFYQCCKSGPALHPFVDTRAYRFEAYPCVVLYSLAATACVVVILGLSIPLLMQLARGEYREASNARERGREPSYSTYNLYLVYLAIPDLTSAIFYLMRGGSLLKQYTSYYLSSYAVGAGTVYAVVMANLWLNAIILYQVMILLNSIESAQRVSPPSLALVTFQAATVYFFSAMTGVFTYFVFASASYMTRSFEKKEIIALGNAHTVWVNIVMLLPIGYVMYVTMVVCRRGYLRITTFSGTPREKAMAELAVYFFRITGVFMVIWTPALTFSNIAYFIGRESIPWSFYVANWTSGIQAIATFLVILTKSDARKYILDLVTLSYLTRLFRGRCQGKKKSKPSQEIKDAPKPKSPEETPEDLGSSTQYSSEADAPTSPLETTRPSYRCSILRLNTMKNLNLVFDDTPIIEESDSAADVEMGDHDSDSESIDRTVGDR